MVKNPLSVEALKHELISVKGGGQKCVGILIRPKVGTIPRPNLVAAAREVRDVGFDEWPAAGFVDAQLS